MVNVQATEFELRPLMIASLDGDAEAHRVLLIQLSRRLRAYFRGRLARLNRGAVEAEDLVQEALMAIHTRRHTYDVSQPLTAWVYAIARYKLLDYLRRTNSAIHDIAIDEAENVMAHNDAKGVESTVDLDRLLRQVSPKMRRAIQYVKLDGLSVREAAERSGMSESAVKVSIHRGLKAVARLIRQETSR